MKLMKCMKRKSILIMVAFFQTFVICMSANSLENKRPKSDPDIITCIRKTKSLIPGRNKIADINRDGERDCIDLALSFKVIWDELYSYKCEIVRNNNPQNGMNHLFVRVYDNSKNIWIYVEPDSNLFSYEMKSVWGDRYNPKYNYYGESYRWMKEIVLGKCAN